MSTLGADLQEAQRLYAINRVSPLCLSDRQYLVELRRRLYNSAFKTQMEQTMPATCLDSIWHHPCLNPTGTPPNGEIQVYLWQVGPLVEPIDIEMPTQPKEAAHEQPEVSAHYEGTAQVHYSLKPRNL